MSKQLAGKTISVYTKPGMGIDEITAALRSVFGKTLCPGCQSGAILTLREADELELEDSVHATAVIS